MPDFLCFLWRGVLMILIIAAYIFIKMAYSEINKRERVFVPFPFMCYAFISRSMELSAQFSSFRESLYGLMRCCRSIRPLLLQAL